MKFRIKIIAIITLTWQVGFSQNNFIPKNSPPVPEVYSLLKFSEIPVSNTTGVPNISLPIYTIKIKNLEYPIALNYNSSGVRIDEIASNVGLGWNINAAGVIYQQINGLDDNNSTSWVNSIPNDRELDTANPPPSIYGQANEDYYFVKDYLTAPQQDTQRDVYSVSCGELSTKFFFDNNGIAHTMQYSPLKIFKDGPYKFIILDEKGNKYTFERISEKDIYTITTTSPNPNNSTDVRKEYTFNITKIENTYNEIINFYYDDERYLYEEPSSFTEKKIETGLISSTNYSLIGGHVPYVEIETKNYIVNKGKRLNSITVNSGENINFIYDTCARLDLPYSTYSGNTGLEVLNGGFSLKKIVINKTNIKNEYYLNYEYFNLNNFTSCVSISDYSSKDSYRLKLKSIIKNNEPPYSFFYNENTLLPNRLNNFYDHWGFFCNSGGRYSINHELGFYDGVSREPNLEATKLGVLNKIIYPTGGSTVFNYELNTTFGEVKTYATISDMSAGDIISTENLQPPFETQYLEIPFVIPNNCIGPVKIKKYVNSGEQTTTNFVSIYITDENNNPANLTENLDLTNPNSGAVSMYYLSDFQTNKTYKLHIIGIGEGLGAFIFWKVKNGEDTVIEKNFDIGGLRIKEILNYDKSNATSPSSRKFYEYKDRNFVNKSSGRIIANPQYCYSETKSYPFCSSADYSAVNNTNANIFSYRCRNSKNLLPLAGLNGYHVMYDDVRIYDDSNKVNGYIDYKYSYGNDDSSYITILGASPTSKDFLRGDLLEQSFYKWQQSTNTYKLLKKITNEFEYNYTEGVFSPASKFNESSIINLLIQGNNPEYICPRLYGTAVGTNLFASYNFSYSKLSSIWKYKSKSTTYDYENNSLNPIVNENNYNYNNPLHGQITSITSKTSNNETLETKYFYPQDIQMVNEPFKNDLIAKNIIGIPLDTQNFKAGVKISEQKTEFGFDANTSNLLLPKYVYLKKGIDSPSNPLEKKVTYNSYDNKGNITQYTPESGTSTTIIWGYNQTQPIAKIENATYASVQSQVANLQTISNTGTEANLITALNALRTSLPNAMVTTYTHKPLIGVSTITDPKGDKIMYNYDPFKRLLNVTDKNGNILSENQYNYKP